MTVNRIVLTWAAAACMAVVGMARPAHGPATWVEAPVLAVEAGPGTDGTVILCSTGTPVQLIDFLGGSPDPGGTWSGPAAHPGTFDPATDAPGMYTYTVPGPPVASATVTVVVNTAPDAGANAVLATCSNGVAVDLFTVLGGSPDAGGSWSFAGNPVGNIFTPGVSAPGVYTYTVAGTAPCPNATATVTVTVTAAPNAGTSANVAVCSNEAPFSLLGKLGGTPNATGTWTFGGNPVANTFTPGTSTPGIYTYTVAGTPPCANATATVTVTVNALPNAGINGTLTVCSNSTAVDLFTMLGGTPDHGGVWTFGGNPVGNNFTPGTSLPGIYTYTVPGTPPCPNATATVTATVVQAPVAGDDRSITVCSDDAPFSMLAQLGGTPDAGGMWSPGGSNIFTPGTSAPGVYTYVVPGTVPCANDTAKLNITVRQAPDAGSNRTVVVCSDAAVFNLVDSLGGTPDGGGTWTGPNGAHSGQFQPGTDPSGNYVYHVAGQAPCAPATATVTVTVRTAPNAGTSSNVVKCSNDAAFTLLSQLGGTPDAGGAWSGPGGVPFPSGNFIPGTTPPGLYTYTVAGQSPCTPAVATVNVTVIPAPKAGTNGTHTVCSTDGTFALFAHLGGTPDVGGSWTGPGNVPVPSGNFNPASSTPGVYTYRVTGTSPCADATATVTVSVVAAANAGSNGSVTLCSTSPDENLFPHLGGTPDAGGTWTKPPPAGGTLAGGVYKPSDPTHPAGTYTYTVTGATPCPNVSATVQVVEHQAPNAGIDAVTTQCSTNPPFSMRTILGGGPDAGGTWLNSSGTVVPSTFTPGTTAPGIYRYVLLGQAPCLNDTSQVAVNVNAAPKAGNNGAVVVCSDDAPVDLFMQLGGTPDAGGTWTNPNNAPNNGSFVPGPTAVQGGYTYRVAGLSPCADATAVVTVTQHRRPVAGNSATVAVCSTDGPINLFNSLGGTPDAGGTWTGPGGASSNGVFVPATAGTFVYKYKVTGTAPCAPDSALVTVNVTQAPYAGESGVLTICAGQPTVDLFTVLGGIPDMNGTWSELTPTGRLSAHFFNPGIPTQLPPGTYGFRYVVPASASCPGDTANAQVIIVPLLNAGNNGTKTVCSTETQVNLFTALGGSPQPGGTWLDLDGTGLLTGQFFNANGAGAGSYHFRYRLTGTLSCTSDSAQVTVNVVAAPNAGHEGWATFCSEGPAVSLMPYISPASPGGTWRKPAPGNQVFSGTYVPATFDPGDYTYTVSGTGPCSAAVTVLHISETQGPNAGNPAVVTKCASDGAFNMTASLGGAPALNGTWKDPSGNPHSDMFVPGQDPPGVYIYTVPGTFPCVDKSSSLTVNVNIPPNAGGDHSKTVCDNSASFQLFDELTGADMGGQWFDPVMAPLPTGTFLPGTSMPGIYTYRVTGMAPCGTAEGTVHVFVTQSPDAGTSVSIALCANDPSQALVNKLGGTPDPTGTWVGPAPLNPYFSGIFQPGMSAPGVYTYTVNGVPPCTSASSTVSVSVAQPPSAGLGRTINVCSNSGLFAMVDSLGGSPNLNGTWWRLPSGPASNGIFNSNVPPGTYSYRYTVQPTGNSPCAAAQATLTINVSAAPNAGGDGNLTLCSTSGITALFPYLTGAPQSGGTWIYNNQPHASGFNPNIDQAGIYAYVVQGTGGCKNDTALVTVGVNQPPSAGSNGVLTICDDTLAAIVLRNVLNGSPNTGGAWVNADTGLPADEIYVPGNFGSGVHTFTYTVQGQAPCPSASAQATIIQNAHAVAGNDASVVMCSDGGSLNLFPLLGPSANPAGNWINSAGAHASSVFVPVDSGLFVFRYIVDGAAPCVNDTAKVSITVNRKPNAGISTAPQLCSDGPMVSLFTLLGGTPDNNGTWAYHPLVGAPVAHDPTFNPAVDPPGKYVYTVAGTPPCTNSTATVQITLVPRPDAGLYGTMSVCVSDNAVQLFNGLNGTPQSGGTWFDLDGTGQLSNGVFNASGVPPGTYRFRYGVPPNGPCQGDTATVRVTVTPELDAGQDSSVTFCLNEVNLLTPYLGGSPQPGGTWTGLGSQAGLINGVLNCAVAGEGTHQYQYVLSGSPSCAPDTATLTVTILNGPKAGHGVPTNVCSSQTPFDLFNLLSPPYDTDGQWYGPSGNPLASTTFNPATGPAGAYMYVVAAIGTCPADTATVPITITPAANPGTSGTLSFCSNGQPGLLSSGLGGTPDTNGSWTFGTPPLPHGNVFNPLTDPAGNYFYTVPAQGPCPAATATVLVTKVPAPFAGDDNTYTFCSSDGPFNMLSHLAGNPQSGGVWRRDGNPPTAHGATYNPAVDSSGVFLYILTGAAPCANDTARLTVVEVPAPQAGTSATLNVCPTDTLVDLFAALGSDADSTGIWQDADNNVLPNGNFNPSQANTGTYVFSYAVPGAAPCDTATATVTVNVGAGLNPGIGGNDTICGANLAYDLFLSLGGTPDPGGIWTEQTGIGAISGSLLDATSLVPGAAYPMVYTVEDPGCGQMQSVVFLFISPFPNPGQDTTVVVCSTNPAFPLEDLLRNAEPGGTWTGPGGQPVNGIFDPATDLAGTYAYVLAGNEFCADTAAHITVQVNLPANAGSDAALQACNDGQIDLYPLLGGAAPGGTWSDPDATGALQGGMVDAGALPAGQYHFRYRVDVAGCPSESAEVLLTVVDGVVVSDLERVCNEQDRTYIVRFTLSGGDAASYSVTGAPGTISAQAPYVFTSQPIFTSQPFAFMVDDANHCAPVVVEGETPCAFPDAVFVPESFTPNGDNINDSFVIPGIEGYPNNTIHIFNRWGGEVYKATGYDNVRVVWDGSSPDALLPGDASTGTYYYVLDLGNGTDPIKGFVYLNR
ncbi:MAG TPA: gliding motility-associated C-terminal domain-containing protein [Flavobacteriales bacterium]|nr:gliding motility-associated C-terminal domain-containing protein [Flavobacteriales bacterium]